MKKLIPLILLFILVMSFSVYANVRFDSVSASPSSIAAGGMLNLRVTVTNLDAGSSGSVDTLVTDATGPDGAVIRLPNDLVAAGLFPDGSIPRGASRTFDIAIDLPDVPTTPGVYSARFTVHDILDNRNHVLPFSFTILNPLVVKLNGADVSNTLSIDLESGESDNLLTLTLENRGGMPLTNVKVMPVFGNLEDNDRDVIIITPSEFSAGDINPSGTATVTFNFDVDSGFDAVTKDGNLQISADEFGDRIVAYGFKLNVKPLTCSPNARSRYLDLDIDEPEDDDEFEPGETINVKLNLNNNGDDDIDAKIEAIIYNMDKDKKIDSKKITKRVRDNNDIDVEFEMNLDDNNDDDFRLFIKAFDDDNEEDCMVEEVDLDVQKPEHGIKIMNPTISPMVASCGARISGNALLRNIGENDEVVMFSVSNTQLGLSQVSESFEMEEGEDELRPVNFAFVVPDNAQQGTYQVLFRARYSGRETLSQSTLNIQPCERTLQAQTSALQPQNLESEEQPAVLTGSSVYSEKGLFDKFNSKGSSIPTSVWVLVDVFLVALIISVLVWVFRPR